MGYDAKKNNIKEKNKEKTNAYKNSFGFSFTSPSQNYDLLNFKLI